MMMRVRREEREKREENGGEHKRARGERAARRRQAEGWAIKKKIRLGNYREEGQARGGKVRRGGGGTGTYSAPIRKKGFGTTAPFNPTRS